MNYNLLDVYSNTTNSYINIGSILKMRYLVNTRKTAINSVGNNDWRSYNHSSGEKRIRIQISGVFLNTSADVLLKDSIFEDRVLRCRVRFTNGDTLEGSFVIDSYERDSEYKKEESFSMNILSSGEVVYS